VTMSIECGAAVVSEVLAVIVVAVAIRKRISQSNIILPNTGDSWLLEASFNRPSHLWSVNHQCVGRAYVNIRIFRFVQDPKTLETTEKQYTVYTYVYVYVK
jgi:hypothetical protein